MIKITVLIPVYNGLQYIEKAVRSVCKQSYQNWNIILLDDESTDHSLACIEALAAQDKRIRVIQKKNDGKGNTAANLKVMYEYADGDYFFYMSQDDWITADLFARAVKRIEQTGAEVVIPHMMLAYANGVTRSTRCSLPPGNNDDVILNGTEAFYQSIDFSISGFAMIHRSLMLDPRCDTRFFDSDEYNTRIQMLWARKVAFCEGCFYYYQSNENAITKKFSVKQFQRLDTAIMLGNACEEIFRTRDRLTKVKLWKLRVYMDLTVKYFRHTHSLSHEERESILTHFRQFEQEVSFDGYRRQILHNLNRGEAALALFYFLLGNCRNLMWMHKLYTRGHS